MTSADIETKTTGELTAGSPENTELLQTHAAHRGSLKKDEFYSVQKGGALIPSARALQKLANAQNINSEVLRVEWQNSGSLLTAICTAYVRAWIGRSAKPRQEQTEALTMNMSAIVQRYVAKKLKPGWGGKPAAWKHDAVMIDENKGVMMPLSKAHQIEMYSFLTDQLTFLERSAITKCQSRVFDKLLRPEAYLPTEGEEKYTEEDDQVDSGPETALPGQGDSPREKASGVHEDGVSRVPTPQPQSVDTEEPTKGDVAEVGGVKKKSLRDLYEEAPQGSVTSGDTEEDPKLGKDAKAMLRLIAQADGVGALQKLAGYIEEQRSFFTAEEHAHILKVFWGAFRKAP